MRGIAFALVSACLLLLVPGSAEASGSGTSAYAGATVSPHDSVHASASAEATAPETGCSITGGQASLSVTYVHNPVPFSKTSVAVLVGNAHPELVGSGCIFVSGSFNERPCIPTGPDTCQAPMSAGILITETSIPIDVVVTADGVGPSGELVQDTATCSMTFLAFSTPPTCDLT